MIEQVWITLALALVAALYASVGQAGATGYLAVMGMAGFAPEVMKPTALALNILVSAIGTVLFWRAGHFSWRSFYPFGVLGFPFSLIGGALNLSGRAYYPLVGVLLMVAAVLMLRSALNPSMQAQSRDVPPPFALSLGAGAFIGFVSGVTGTGGGVFLAPILLATGWVEPRRTAAVSAAYNLLNSSAALVGAYATLNRLPPALPVWMIAVGLAALLGSIVGSRYVSVRGMRLVLALVLMASAVKMIL